MTDSPMRAVVIDDHLVVRNEVRRLVVEAGGQVVAEGGTAAAAVARTTEFQPDLLLLDLDLPDGNALDVIGRIRSASPGTRILVLTVSASEVDIRRALAAGASGYLTKDLAGPAVVGAVAAVASGATMVTGRALDVLLAGSPPNRAEAAEAIRQLSAREREILGLLAEGLSAAGVASRLHLSVRTVEGHARSILARLNARNRAEAVRIYVESGIGRDLA